MEIEDLGLGMIWVRSGKANSVHSGEQGTA